MQSIDLDEDGTASFEAIDYRSLFAALPSPALVLVPDRGQFIVAAANDAYLAAVGRARDELIGRSAREAFPDNPDASGAASSVDMRTSLERVLASRQPETMPVQRYDVPRADGSFEERWWDAVNTPVPGPTGEVHAIIHHVVDVTHRVRTERARQESDWELRNLTDALPVLVSYIDADERYRFVNKTYEQWFGRSRDEIEGRHMRDVLGPEAYDQLRPAVNRALSGERFRFDSRVSYRDGGARDVHVEYVPRLGSDGRARGYYALVEDVGDRVKAEIALRESEERFRNMADHAPVMMWVTDPTGACTYLNRAWYEFTGQTEAEAAGLGWLDATHPDDSAEAGRIFLEANARQKAFRLEYRLRGKDGAYRWAIDAAAPRFGPDGAFLGYIGSVIDIDERRAAEQRLAVNEERLRLATDAADIGFWDVDVVMDELIWPPRLKAMFGISAHVPVTMTDFYEGLHRDDRAYTSEAFAAACDPERRALYDVEYRTVGKEDHIVRWVAAKGRALFDQDGRCVRVVGTAIDVTARKHADEQRQREEVRLRFFSALDEALRTSRDAPEAMAAATELLARHLGASRCAYADVDTDESNDRFFIRSDWAAPGFASSVGTYSLKLFGPRAVGDLRQGRTLIVRDVAAELAPGEGREMFQSIGIDAIICCPLVKDGHLAAMMAIHQDRARDWQPDEIALVEAVVDRCWAHVERVGAEARLRASEERYRTLFTTIESGFCIAEVRQDEEGRPDYRILEANPAFYRQTGFSEEILRRWLREAEPALEEHWYESYAAIAFSGEPKRFEQGSAALGRWFDVYAFRVGEPSESRVAILFNDISARRNAEIELRELNETLEARVLARTAELESAHEQLRQSQKMEAMGQLTGGVAHDFNNLLTPIVGALDLLKRKGVGGDREQRLIGGAVQSADRAKTLVQRLLAFARRQPLQTSSVDVAMLTRGMADLVASTTGPQIKVVVDASDDLPAAVADPNQLEMAILNLSVNARDAMPDGGTLRISVGSEEAPSRDARLKPGRYVRLSVADTGIGMDEATLERAIEPFFSTKGIGKGTGLGLSMVHGLASQLGGALLIHSRPGMGTNVEMWIPASDSSAANGVAAEIRDIEHAPKGTALLVDDEDLVRASTADMLMELGHEVIEASSAEAALKLLDQGLRPDLLVTDHLMPGITGTELARIAQNRLPGMRTLIVSGYADVDGIAADLPRLIKPYGSAELAAAIGAATASGRT